MNLTDKAYGQDLKAAHKRAINVVNNLEHKINKRYELIVNNYSQYISQDHKRIMSTDMTLDQKLNIIINAEDNYIKQNTNQLDLF